MGYRLFTISDFMTCHDNIWLHCTYSMRPDHRTGKAVQHIQFDAYDVNEFEYKLNT